VIKRRQSSNASNHKSEQTGDDSKSLVIKSVESSNMLCHYLKNMQDVFDMWTIIGLQSLSQSANSLNQGHNPDRLDARQHKEEHLR
jgi:hypothetical protein